MLEAPPMHPEAEVPVPVGTSRATASGLAVDLAPVPGWVTLVQLALDAALATDPPATFACRARWGRLAWIDVRGAAAFVELLWALEELSATLCELCGAPAVNREGWDGVVRTLCPRHAVDVTAAGPRAPEVYARAWEALGVNDRTTEHGGT